MDYFVIGQDGQKYGPANMDTLRQWVREGRVNGGTRLEPVTGGPAIMASQLPDLGLSAGPQMPPPGQFPSFPGPSGYGQFPPHPGMGMPGTSGPLPGPHYGNQPYQMGPAPPNHVVKSAISLLFCCVGGVIALISASKVDSLWASGRFAEAQAASNNANNWANASLIIGAIGAILRIIASV